MRKLLAVLLVASTISATAQQPASPAVPQPPAGSNWQHVQALPVGANINVKARTKSLGCKLKSVDADSLTCTHGKDVVFQRTDILTIKIPRRGRSALIGAAIGGGAGAIAGFATGTSPNGFFGPNFLRGALTAGGAIGVGLVGSIVGATTDFAKSTVYKAP